VPVLHRASRARLLLVLSVVTFGCGDRRTGGTAEDVCPASPPDRLEAEVVAELAHDPTAFTQGLVFDDDGSLYESTGLEGSSTVREVDPVSGEVMRLAALDDELFGEGLAVDPDGQLVQLTWKEGRALRWDTSTLEPTGEQTYDGEGWGLALVSPTTFAMTDGSDTVTLRDARDLSVQERVPIELVDAEGSEPEAVDRLNELEWDGRHLWANRWQTDEVLRIDLECGRVDGVLDAGALHARAAEVAATSGQDDMDVLNGIASTDEGELLLTGKRWPVMFRVRVRVPESA
jgi:glutaminyl-peptide cyclotransferase